MADSLRAIVALGNPGVEHTNDRHNAGFWLGDALAHAWGVRFRAERRHKSDLARRDQGNDTIWLQKPLTFMNNSGEAVQSLCAFYKIPASEVLVVHDDLDLPPGAARLKRGGGHGGHNGLRDIHRVIGADYYRLRIGIGHPGERSGVLRHVLSAPAPLEREQIHDAIDAGMAALTTFVDRGWDRAVQQLHTRSETPHSKPDGKPESKEP